MARMRLLAVLLLLASLVSSCGGRELAWLVPRASVGLVLRSSDTGVATEGYVLLRAPLAGPTPRHVEDPGPGRELHLLGRGPRCRVAALCRWEATSSTEAITELAREEAP